MGFGLADSKWATGPPRPPPLGSVVVCSAMWRSRCSAVIGVAFSVPLAASPARADTPPSRALSVGVDLGFRAARDDLIVPLASSGPTLGFGVRFLGKAGPGLVDSGVRFELGPLFDRYTHPAAGLFHALRLGYLPLVRTRPSDWSLALGPLLVWETDVLWLRAWDDAHAYWMGRRYLGFALRAWRPLWPTWRLDLSGEFSLLGFESRPAAYRVQNEDPLTQVAFYFEGVWLLLVRVTERLRGVGERRPIPARGPGAALGLGAHRLARHGRSGWQRTG